jgi:putative membrane protein
MLSIGLYAWLVAYLEISVLELRWKSSTMIHSLLGFVISLMLVFRTNTAYERWSEGRRLWGSLVNCSRNLMIQLRSMKIEDAIIRHTALLVGNYAFALKNHLRDDTSLREYEQDAHFNLSSLESQSHGPNYLAFRLYAVLAQAYEQCLLSDAQLLVLNQELRQLTDICGACERIKKTPIPFSYSLFLKKFLFAYIMTMPFGFVSDFGYWIIVIVVFVFYVLASLELIAEEIEQPFGVDQNDLPLRQLAETIRGNARDISYLTSR